MHTTTLRARSLPALAAALLLSGCGGPTVPDMLIDPIQIDHVEVVVMDTSPATVAVHVTGVLGDGCSELHSVSQDRSGNTVTVTILRERPRAAICSQIAKLYDQSIQLGGSFPPGRYLVRVNGVEETFAITGAGP